MDQQAPWTLRSEAFVEDLTDDAWVERSAEPAWASRALLLCGLPLAASLLGGVAAFLQTVA